MKHKSLLGYRADSPYQNEPFIEIDGSVIDMSETPIDLIAIPDKGKPKLLKGGTGLHKFKGAKKVTEVPAYQHGGTNIMSGLAGESTVPVSPFIDLKPFIDKYKLQYGGVIDYMTTLPLEVQGQFAQDFESLDKGEKDEVVKMMCGGKYQDGGDMDTYLTKAKKYNKDVQKFLQDLRLPTDGTLPYEEELLLPAEKALFRPRAESKLIQREGDKYTGQPIEVTKDKVKAQMPDAWATTLETNLPPKKPNVAVPTKLPTLLGSITSGTTPPTIQSQYNLQENGNLIPLNKKAYDYIMRGKLLKEYKTGKTLDNTIVIPRYQIGGISEYQRGGQENAELESGETLIGNDGELQKITGKKHSEGGEKVSLPNGTRIYSEFLDVPNEVASEVLGKETKKKYSYAQLSKKFPTKPYLEILQEDEDEYKVEGAKIKLANNLAKLDTLFFAQEQEKQNKDMNKFQYGGIKKYQLAGETPPTFQDYLNSIYQGEDYSYDYPVVHTEPSPTVTTGVVLNLRNDKPIQTINLPEIEILDSKDKSVNTQVSIRKPQPKSTRKPVGNRTNPLTPVTQDTESDLWQVPLPLDTLPQRSYSSLTSNSGLVPSTPTQEVAEAIVETSDERSYPGTTKDKWKFGISNKLAGTIADIGLAMSDKLNVKEPTLYNRQKTPLFTRFVDFDDQDVARTFSLRSQQIQNSNMPEQVKQAQLSALNSEYQDYQAKVDFANLQRYEQKREMDTNKLQQYTDNNIDIKVEDMEFYNQRRARVEELRDAFKSQRKSRIVNSLKQYAQFADDVRYKNELSDNYALNPITGNIQFKEKGKSNLENNLLRQFQQSNPKIDLGQGSTGQMIGNLFVVTDKDGKVSVNKIEQ